MPLAVATAASRPRVPRPWKRLRFALPEPMSRLEADLHDQNAATAPAEHGVERDHASEPLGAIARPQPSPALNPALFTAQSSSTLPALGASPSGYKRPTPSSEWWVQITLCVIVTILLLAVISAPKRGELPEDLRALGVTPAAVSPQRLRR